MANAGPLHQSEVRSSAFTRSGTPPEGLTPNPASGPLLQVTRLQKSYNVPVLVDFSFALERGEVHALVGSNGAGKSTFARILSGLTDRDGGDIQLEGRPYNPGSKREAEHAGVIMVLQELNVIGTMSIAENIFLNRLPRRGGFLRFVGLHNEARQALSRVGLGGVDPSTPAGFLGVGQQQLVEIAGALSQNCRLLILDEPTAALTDPEIEQLFENIRQLQKEGVGIIYVSHRMDEIRRIADRITVMRDGRVVATHQAGDVTPAELVREMVGHDLPERKKSVVERPVGEVALRVRNLRAGDQVRDVSFELRRGEILGIAGLIGSGRTETLRAIFGADAKDGGEILVGEQPVVIRSPADALRAGIGLVPEDRKQDGLLLPQPIRVNTTLSTIARHANAGGWLDTRAETKTTESFCGRLQVQCTSHEQTIGELSGGNQQKVVIARWLARDCRILLFDEPTRGIDVAAKHTIYQLLHDLAAEGKAVMVVSSELVELMALCDRLLVMSQGRITAEFTPDEWTQEKITQAAFSGYLDQKESAIAT
ncbi:MAG: sugar ABC transporter ATP-binding protein [Verrucomicrobiales bacterium]|nr:sugar ABC transporter ATP-binding protein [Verrucomicrobiales bacterium]